MVAASLSASGRALEGAMAATQRQRGGSSSAGSTTTLAAKFVLAAVVVGLLRTVPVNSVTLASLAASLEGWTALLVGCPAVIVAVALVAKSRQAVPLAQHIGRTANINVTGAPKPSSSTAASSLESCSPHSARTKQAGGGLRRLARRIGRRLNSGAVRFTGSQELHSVMEVPFLRVRSVNRSASRASSVQDSEHGSVQSGRLQQTASSQRGRVPSMARIASGQNLHEAGGTTDMGMSVMTDARTDADAASETSKATNKQSCEEFVYNGHLAVDCLPYDTTEPAMAEVRNVVTEQHLLQFGMMLGESSAELAIGMQAGALPVGPAGSGACLYGATDDERAYTAGWVRVVEEHTEGLHYWVDRRPLRKGLYMYKTRAVYERCATDQMVAFHFSNCQAKRDWDDSCVALQPLPPPCLLDMPEPALNTAAHAQSAFVYARSRFPPPMAQREYVYARRVWYKADDGGVYCVQRACSHPAPPPAGCRVQRIDDFVNGFVMRAVPGIYSSAPATEVVTTYFEDSRAHAGIINMAIRKALWPMTQKSEAGLRRFIARSAGQLPPRRGPPFLKQPPAEGCGGCAATAAGGASSSHGSADARALVQTGTAATHNPPSEVMSKSAYTFLNFTLDTAFTNASMFSGYYPALTTRLQIAPKLYSGYLALWRSGAEVVAMMRAMSAAVAATLLRWHRWHRMAAWRASALLRRGANVVRRAVGLPPLPEREPSSFPIKPARRRLSRAVRLASMAVKAVGLQLVRGLVVSKRGGSVSGNEPLPAVTGVAREGLSPDGTSDGARAGVRQRRKLQDTRSRRMLGVMLGLDASGPGVSSPTIRQSSSGKQMQLPHRIPLQDNRHPDKESLFRSKSGL